MTISKEGPRRSICCELAVAQGLQVLLPFRETSKESKMECKISTLATTVATVATVAREAMILRGSA